MKYYITILTLFIQFNAYSIDNIDSLRYEYARNAPKNLTLEELANYLKSEAESDSKIVETFFYWISTNIEYSLELKNKSDLTKEDVSAQHVFDTKKTICAGYSNLLFELCEQVNIECVVIHGIAQDYIEDEIDSTNHAWNAVKIQNEWKLIDPTWGSGGFHFGSTKYERNLKPQYLFADPKFLLIDHFPEDKNWQLVENPITYEQFQGKEWKEMRFRKFNNLLDEEAYEIHKQVMKNNGWE